MNTKLIIASSLMLLGSLVPASAYHITGVDITVESVSVKDLAGDWVLDGSPLILCESDGPGDPDNAFTVPHQGVGGLCNSGRNGVTGVPAPSQQPAKDVWTKLDVCDSLTASRWETGETGRCDEGNSLSVNDPLNCVPVVLPCNGRIDMHGYTAEVGAFGCFVPTDNAVASPFVATDYALYYSELYAWFSYEGSGNSGGFYSSAAIESGDQGHASVFPDPTASDLIASLAGSVETTAVDFEDDVDPLLVHFTGPPIPMTESPTMRMDLSNHCGLSSAGPSTTFAGVANSGAVGPVVRAPYQGSYNADDVMANELCQHVRDFYRDTKFPCNAASTCDRLAVGIAVQASGREILDDGKFVTAGITGGCSSGDDGLGTVSGTVTATLDDIPDSGTATGAASDTVATTVGAGLVFCEVTATNLQTDAFTSWQVSCT